MFYGWCIGCGKELYNERVLEDGFAYLFHPDPCLCKDCVEKWINKSKENILELDNVSNIED